MATINKGYLDDKINGIKINSSKRCHSSNLNYKSARNVLYIVMHYTGNEKDKAVNNANYFQRANCKASAHFFVDDTTIYQSVALKDIAWHCGASTYYSPCRNASSFGVEMCCTAGNYMISDKTIDNAAHLCAHLCKMLGIAAKDVDTYVLRHYDVTHKKCPAQMANSANDADWIAFKEKVKDILEPKFKSYLVKIDTDELNVRAGAGTKYNVMQSVCRGEVFTIVEERMNGTTKWGKLKSGAGWISLAYTKKL